MAEPGVKNRLDGLMDRLEIRASALADASGADHSLITKWRRGERSLTKRSHHLPCVSDGLIALDADGQLAELLAPWRQKGESMNEALCEYLTGRDMDALPPRVDMPQRPTRGEYTVQYRVYIGQDGLRSSALTMLDYVMSLPPGREIRVVCHGDYTWMVRDSIDFVSQFVNKLNKALDRGTTITLVNHMGYQAGRTTAFAGPWLVGHLRGSIRSRYYDGPIPRGPHFVSSIKSYWSAHVEYDDVVEDGIFATMYTDPVNILPDEALCEEHITGSRALSQYGFFRNPEGNDENPRLWPGGDALPAWPDGDAPGTVPCGDFSAVTRVPSLGIMTKAEYLRVAESDRPEMPGYLFSGGAFSPGTHRIILCREDVQEGLAKKRRMNEPLSEILHRRAFVPSDMLAGQLRRLLAAIDKNPGFEVALMPRVAFERLDAELVVWKDSAAVGWLQDRSESIFTNSVCTSAAFRGTIDFVWDRMLAGWKRKELVARQLRKWLAGRGLDEKPEDSAVVRGWDLFPH